MATDTPKLRLGSATVQRLLPQRPPLLFIDFVASYERAPRPTLCAGRHISANDPTFAGHFPELGIWPGVFTVEGLNQACNLLASISSVQKEWEQSGRDPAEVLDGLRQLDQMSQFKPTLGSNAAKAVLEVLGGPGKTFGLSVGIDIRFKALVFPGSRLDYVVSETHAQPAAVLYEVEALVDGSVVAKGKLTLSRGHAMPSLTSSAEGSRPSDAWSTQAAAGR